MSTANSSRPRHDEPGAPPTDLELMLYVDGELDEARHHEVELHVLRDPRCYAKVAALELAAGVVRDRALAMSSADGIADDVIAKISAQAVTSDVTDGDGAAVKPPSPETPAGMRPVLETRALRKSPANDNTRGVLALAAIAVAAAAALMIWRRTETEPHFAAATSAAPIQTVSPPMAPTGSPTAQRGESEIEPGVEVAAVDFGARMGTIFYVPKGATASSAMTTVVWLSDSGPGGE